VFLYALAALLPAGIYAILRDPRQRSNRLLLAGFFCAPVAAVLVTEVKINRALIMMPFAVLIASIGIRWMLERGSRAWTIAAAVLIVAMPLQFRSFYQDYMGDYRMRSGYWFENNIRGAIAELIRRNPPGSAHRIYLSTDIQWIDWYWPLYLVKERREDLRSQTTYFDPKTIDVSAVPAHSTIVGRSDAAAPQPFGALGAQRNLTAIMEPNGTSYFAVFDR
jgi:hypothetical protein